MLASVKEERAHANDLMVPPVQPAAPQSVMPQPEIHPADALSRQMRALHRVISSRVMGAMQEQLQDDDLSFSQMTALHQLRAHAPLSVGGLADLTGLSLPAASHLTDRLVQRGYAQRRENPGDRRAKLLIPTELGLKVVAEMDCRFTDTYRDAFAAVSPQAIGRAAESLGALLAELTELRAAQAIANAASPTPERCPMPPE